MENGKPQPLVAGTHIELTFEQRDTQGVVRWEAGCNINGSLVDVTDERLVLHEIAGTAIGCPDDLQQQDEWLADFFRSNPAWGLSGERLRLTSGDIVIELVPKSA